MSKPIKGPHSIGGAGGENYSRACFSDTLKTKSAIPFPKKMTPFSFRVHISPNLEDYNFLGGKFLTPKIGGH